ncbi:MAG: aldo/keto reductase [Anaerolineae bacterium]|nr:aldo/keto reductase [Anaerolineae bacterium]
MFRLPTTLLGRTGLRVTRLGVGGAYCKTPEGYQYALDSGVNYLDTAPAYHEGKDEEYVGKAIAGRRQNLVLATKVGKRDAAGARQELETSLRLLGTDYIDIWQLHYLNKAEEREQALGPGGALETAVKAREQGLIRFIGVTGHIWDEIAKAVATGLFDTVLCWYSCAKREPESNVFVEASKHNTGVIIMNATGTDKLLEAEDAPPLADFYRYVLGHPAVNVVLRGNRDPQLFCKVAKALADNSTLTEEQRAEMEVYGARMRAMEKPAD